MNKIKLITTLTILGGILLTLPVLAATNLSFSPVNVNVTSGETFNIVVSVNPQGIKNYTIKTEVEFPADLLEIKSFSFGNNWMPLSQPGYDLIDNTNGLLVKTAGYPGGLSSIATFGIISFSAKKDGTGTISLGNNSFALDATNQDLLSGTSQTSIIVTVPAPIPVPMPEIPSIPEVPSVVIPTPVVPIPSPSEVEDGEATTTEGEIIPDANTEQQSEETASLLASVGGLISFGTGNVLIGIIVSIIALLIILFIIRGIRIKKSK